MEKAEWPRWLKIWFFIALANFVLYVAIAQVLGGDAVNGHAEGGRYFLSSHGHLTEVSHLVFLYSELHTYLLFITHSVAFFGGIFYYLRNKARKSRSEGN